MKTPPPLPPPQGGDLHGNRLSENEREILGVGRDDWWCYAGWVLLAIACFLGHPAAVVTLFVLSSVLVGTFIAKSTPRYLRANELSPAVRIYCLLGNVFVIGLQVSVLSVKSWFLFKA